MDRLVRIARRIAHVRDVKLTKIWLQPTDEAQDVGYAVFDVEGTVDGQLFKGEIGVELGAFRDPDTHWEGDPEEIDFMPELLEEMSKHSAYDSAKKVHQQNLPSRSS